MCCPNCGRPASGLVGAQQLYTRDIKETGGKPHKGSLSPCPVPGAVDQIRCLCPGSHNKKDMPKPLDLEAESLAQGGMKSGNAVSMQPNGTYSVGPALGHFNQEPAGGVTGGFDLGEGYGADYRPPPGFKGIQSSTAPAYAQFKQTPRRDRQGADNSYLTEKDIEKVKRPKLPAIDPSKPAPKLQTLPVGWDEQINFFGAKPEEKEAYLQSLKKIVKGSVTQAVKDNLWPKNLLHTALTYFQTNRGFMTSLVCQEVLHGEGDTIRLLHYVTTIERDIARYLSEEVKELQACTARLIRVFANQVKIEENSPQQLMMASKESVVSVSAPPPETYKPQPRRKKKRSIRYLDVE